MKYLGLFVKNAPDAMAAVFSYDRIIMGLAVLLDDMSDVTESNARLDDIDCLIEAFLRDLNETLRVLRYFADTEHLTGVAMKAIFYYCDIDINGVT